MSCGVNASNKSDNASPYWTRSSLSRLRGARGACIARIFMLRISKASSGSSLLSPATLTTRPAHSSDRGVKLPFEGRSMKTRANSPTLGRAGDERGRLESYQHSGAAYVGREATHLDLRRS